MSLQSSTATSLPARIQVEYSSQKIDLFSVHDYLVSDGARLAKTGTLVAQRIEREILRGGWKVGSVVGSQRMLRDEFLVGQRGLQEAVRILEARSAARMRPGPGGGLVVAAPSQCEVVGAVADYFETACLDEADISEALATLSELRHVVSRQSTGGCPGADDSLDVEWTNFLSRLTEAPVRAIPSDGSGNDEVIVSLISEALAEIRRRRSVGAPASAKAAASSPESSIDGGRDDGGARKEARQEPPFHPRHGTGKAASQSAELVNKLLNEIADLGVAAVGSRLGTEDDLCDRYSAGRKILRPAIRILENYGVLDSQRGRGGGLVVRRPNARGPIEAVVTYFSSRVVRHSDVAAYCSRLLDVINAIAVRRRTSRDALQLAGTIGNALDIRDAKKIAEVYKCEWGECHNPILIFLMHCISSYNSRLLSSTYTASNEQMYCLEQSFSLRSQAIAANDIAGAREVLDGRSRLLAKIIPVELVFPE